MPRNFRVVAAPEMAPPAMAPTACVVVVSFNTPHEMVKMPGLETKVIAAWLVWIFFRQLQSILGPMRRQSRHWLVQYIAMAAFYLPTLIAFYTAHAVYSSSSDLKIPLSVGCGLLLFLCARGEVTMTAFTLGNRPQRLQSWRLLPWLLYFASLQWGLLWGDRKLSVSDLCASVLLILPVLYVLLAKQQTPVLDYDTKGFADYMVRESRSLSSPFFGSDHPNRMQESCKYPLMLRDDQWIYFRDVIQNNSRLPRDCAVDPDICLSYSFCRLLARRYFGFPCAEDGNAQVRDFVLTELLEDCNRAFNIVEVQLALVHDYFFTNYHSSITSGLVSVKQAMIVLLLFVSLASIVGYSFSFLIAFLLIANREYHLGLRWALAVPALLLLHFLIRQPAYPVLPRYWHPIRNLFLYCTKDTVGSPPSISATSTDPSAAPFSQSSGLSYWQEKMGQYSVMEDYDRRSPMKAIIEWCKEHVLSQASYGFIKHHPAAEKDVSVPGRANTTTSDALYNTTDSLTRLIARTIKDINGPPTIGTRSLGFYRDMTQDDLSWTCRQETVTDTILIWHIATCYFEMSQPPEEETPQQSQGEDMSQSPEEPSTGYRKLATTLSRYCAYLVAFLPELLPEHSLTVKVDLQQVLQETKGRLGGTRMSMDAKRSKVQQLQLPEDESSMTAFLKGVRLGRQLEQQPDVSLRWKAIAEFWAEMILYIASSPDNAHAHIQQLARGGEFVTHLWALLCNAGIVMKRVTEEGTSTVA
ncbi:unnamed protein product [Urochloa decumbens]|uniref:DUF4220 domain-containing protein n=1 Tax=Urochloa decumbens TaxID=240449 RepID=A0ABC9ANV7_9POAL